MLKSLAVGIVLIVLASVDIAHAAQLTVSWTDNSGGLASFRVERRASTSSTYALVGTVAAGVTSWIDASVVSGSSYCYRVQAFTATAVSSFSSEVCAASGTTAKTITVAKAGTGAGTVVSSPAGINCGSVCSSSFTASTVVTLSATPASGSTFGGWSGGGCTGTASCTLATNVSTTVTATFVASTSSPTTAALTLTYNGKLRDRVGAGNTARAADGAADGTLTVRLQASGGRTVRSLKLESSSGGTWDTNSATSAWVLGVATSLDGALLNSSTTMGVNFAVADGGSFVLFASDTSPASHLVPGRTVRVTAQFSDGTSASASTTLSGMTVMYRGKLRDRVGAGNTARAADGTLDGTLSVSINHPGGRTITRAKLASSSGGSWDTDAATTSWLLGVATSLDGSLLNGSTSMAVFFAIADGGSFYLFGADSSTGHFVSGRTLTVTVTFSDGATASASTRVP